MGIMTDRRRRAAGFTLAEMLVVITLITLMASFSVTGLVALKRDLEVTALDESAKELFMAAQDRLTRLSRSGELDKLRAGGTAIGVRPTDFAGDDAQWLSGEYYYANRGDDAAKLLLPLGSIDDSIRLGGSYVIEYSLQSATVYSVFYSEKVTLDYNKLDDAGSLYRASRSGRRRLKIGYYGGGGIARDSVEKCADPIITVENGNELRLLITGEAEGDNYSVKIELADQRGTPIISVPSADIVRTVSGGGVSYSLLLDSMTAGSRFHDKYPSLTAGDDITVKVSFEKADWLSSDVTATVNSLFASRSGNALSGYEAEISCARHLQNLDAGGGVTGKLTARQTANIDLSGGFRSVSNAALELTYEGNKQQLRGLTGTNGVFASLSGAKLRDIYIVNPSIGGDASVGALAGSLSGCTVSGCRVYAYAATGAGALDYSSLSCRVDYSATAGGLVGTASACQFSNSFAALTSLSGGTAGGLIGYAAGGTTVSNCYAACDYLQGGGMLIGGTDGSVSVTNCYAVGESTVAPTFASGAAVSGCYSIYTCNNTVVDDGGALADPSSVGVDETRPYNATLNNKAYPYATIPGLPHFGSWADKCVVNFYVGSVLFGSIECISGGTVNYNDYLVITQAAVTQLDPNVNNFYGWYYIDAYGAKPDFDETTIVLGDMNVYADYGPI